MYHRFDIKNTFITIGSGSRAGHCLIALWKEDELFICESKASSYWYKSGVHCTEYN